MQRPGTGWEVVGHVPSNVTEARLRCLVCRIGWCGTRWACTRCICCKACIVVRLMLAGWQQGGWEDALLAEGVDVMDERLQLVMGSEVFAWEGQSAWLGAAWERAARLDDTRTLEAGHDAISGGGCRVGKLTCGCVLAKYMSAVDGEVRVAVQLVAVCVACMPS